MIKTSFHFFDVGCFLDTLSLHKKSLLKGKLISCTNFNQRLLSVVKHWVIISRCQLVKNLDKSNAIIGRPGWQNIYAWKIFFLCIFWCDSIQCTKIVQKTIERSKWKIETYNYNA